MSPVSERRVTSWLPAVGRFGEVDSSRLPGRVTASVAVSALVVGSSVSAGAPVAAAVIAVATLLFATGWPVLTGAAHRGIQRWVLTGTGLLLALAVAVTSGANRLVWLPVIVAGGMIAAFFLHLLTPSGQDGLTVGMSALLGGIGVLGSGACLVPLALAERGPRYVGVAMVGVVAGAVVEPLGRERWAARWIVLFVMIAGAAGGFLVALESGLPPLGGLGLGLLMATLSLTTRRVFGAQPGTRTAVGQVTVGVASVLVVGVVVLAMASVAGIAPA